MSDKKKTGPKSIFDKLLGLGVHKNPRYPVPYWEMLSKKETKVTVQEMIFSQEFEEKIHRLGAEQKAKRLSDENENTPPE